MFTHATAISKVLMGPYHYITQIPGKQIRTKLAVVSKRLVALWENENWLHYHR